MRGLGYYNLPLKGKASYGTEVSEYGKMQQKCKFSRGSDPASRGMKGMATGLAVVVRWSSGQGQKDSGRVGPDQKVQKNVNCFNESKKGL